MCDIFADCASNMVYYVRDACYDIHIKCLKQYVLCIDCLVCIYLFMLYHVKIFLICYFSVLLSNAWNKTKEIKLSLPYNSSFKWKICIEHNYVSEFFCKMMSTLFFFHDYFSCSRLTCFINLMSSKSSKNLIQDFLADLLLCTDKTELSLYRASFVTFAL